MTDHESQWVTTRSSLFRDGEVQWHAIAAYGPPIRHHLARRYPRLSEQDREDLAQDLLVEIRERLASAHEPSRGKFRQLLQVAVKHRVIDRLRRAARAPGPIASLGDVPGDAGAPSDQEIDAIDLEVALLDSVAAARDDLTQGPQADPAALYALAGRVVHGHSDAEIAAAEGSSPHRVSRLLRKARERIVAHLLARELDPPPGPEALAVAVEAVRDALLRPGERRRIIEDRVSDPDLRDRLDDFLVRFSAASPNLPSLESPQGAELRRSLEMLLS